MKTCLITGGNAGIGRAAAIQIARKKYHVVIGVRNRERGEKALAEIRKQSGSEAVEMVLLDMSSQKSIKSATQVLQKLEKLDVLIHNAADFDISRKEATYSDEGIETVWATNHLGPVLLTDLLMKQLEKSAAGRIITIASKGLVMHPRLEVDLEDPEFRKRRFSVSKAYYQSKLAQVMYTYWLAGRLKESGITANCIRVTNVRVDLDRYPDLSQLARFAYKLKSRSSISAEEMARTYSWLATSGEVNRISGKYFDEKNREVSSSPYSKDQNNIKQVMDLSLKYLEK